MPHTDISLGFDRSAIEPIETGLFDVQLPENFLVPFEVSDDRVVDMPVLTVTERLEQITVREQVEEKKPFNFLFLFLILLGAAF